MSKLICVVGCENKQGDRFEPGDEIPDDAFPRSVLEHWLDKGVLKGSLSKPPKKKKGKK